MKADENSILVVGRDGVAQTHFIVPVSQPIPQLGRFVHASNELVGALRGECPPCNLDSMSFGDLSPACEAAPESEFQSADVAMASVGLPAQRTTEEHDHPVDCPDCRQLMREAIIDSDPVRWDYLEECGLTETL